MRSFVGGPSDPSNDSSRKTQSIFTVQHVTDFDDVVTRVCVIKQGERTNKSSSAILLPRDDLFLDPVDCRNMKYRDGDARAETRSRQGGLL